MRKINAAGLMLVKEFEGCRLTAYKDSVGVLTIGWGHTSAAGYPTVRPGMKITAHEAEVILARDLSKYESAVEKAVKVPLSDNQFAALTSFCYNLGPGNLGKSTLLRFLNNGDFAEAQEQFSRWNKAGGKVLPGLTRRRKAEATLFGSPAPSDVPVEPSYRPPDDPGVEPPDKPPPGGFFKHFLERLGLA